VRRSTVLVAAAVLVASALAGCANEKDPLAGFQGRDKLVAATVLAYATAARNGDARTVCDALLAREAKAPLGQDCVRRFRVALRSIDQQGLQVVAIRYKDDTAIATVVTGAGEQPRSGTLALVQEGGLWRIAHVGPLPRPGADASPPG
jgi:hypothetical protein